MTGSAAMLRRNTLAHAPANPVFLACRPGPVTGSSDSIEYGLTDASGAVLLHCLVEWRASLDTVSGFEAACLEARAVMTLLKAQVRRRDVVLDDITDNPFAYPLEFLGLANSVSHIAFLTRQAAPALRRARLQPGDFDACANPPSEASTTLVPDRNGAPRRCRAGAALSAPRRPVRSPAAVASGKSAGCDRADRGHGGRGLHGS